MRRGRVEEAGALAQRIGKEIIRRSKTRLSRLNPKDGDEGPLGGRATANGPQARSGKSRRRFRRLTQ